MLYGLKLLWVDRSVGVSVDGLDGDMGPRQK